MRTLGVAYQGGGGNGIVYEGADRALNLVDGRVTCVTGASAGAINGLLRVLGYTPEETGRLVGEKLLDGRALFTSFFDLAKASEFSDSEVGQSMIMRSDLPGVPNWLESLTESKLVRLMLGGSRLYRMVFSLLHRNGLYNGDALLTWLSERLLEKHLPSDVTFAQLYSNTGVDFRITAMDLDGDPLVLDYESSPDLEVRRGVRMSMSIPLIWRPVVWKLADGRYMRRDLAGHRIVDGGVTNNFTAELIRDVDKIVAFTLDKDAPAHGDAERRRSLIPEFHEFLARVIEAARSREDRDDLRRFAAQTVRLAVGGIGTLNFDLRDDLRAQAVQAAHDSTLRHLRRRGLMFLPTLSGVEAEV